MSSVKSLRSDNFSKAYQSLRPNPLVVEIETRPIVQDERKAYLQGRVRSKIARPIDEAMEFL